MQLLSSRIINSRKVPFLIKYIFGTVLYLGSRYECPCCGGHSRKFLPYGVNLRLNAQCPRCGSLERHRLLWIYLKDKTNFFTDRLKVLDIAPMEILQRKWKGLPNLDYISADISSSLAMQKIDITNIPLPDNQFDCIICYYVLQHIPNDQKAMRELFRVLKPGGWAILQSPLDINRSKTSEEENMVIPEERKRLVGEVEYVKVFGMDYKDRLESAGYIVRLDDYVKNIDGNKIKKYSLIENEIIYFCTKPRF